MAKGTIYAPVGMFRSVRNRPAASEVRIPINSPAGSRATISSGLTFVPFCCFMSGIGGLRKRKR